MAENDCKWHTRVAGKAKKLKYFYLFIYLWKTVDSILTVVINSRFAFLFRYIEILGL